MIEEEKFEVMSRLIPSTDLNDTANVDFIVAPASENMAISTDRDAPSAEIADVLVGAGLKQLVQILTERLSV